jgi:3-oxoacyl-ACP reductase-like protein
MEIWRKSKLNSEKIGKIWKKPVSRAAAAAIYPRAAAAAATSTTTTAAAAAANRLLENPVEATTIVHNFVLLLVENVV